MDVGCQASAVENDVEIGWRNCALINFLRDQEEIAALLDGDTIVHYRPTRWIRWIVTRSGEKTSFDCLADNHESNARLVINSS